tara:strand:- start:602 stop:1009 length:408 start_codon:yes stop_codon:yes gene_type:complete
MINKNTIAALALITIISYGCSKYDDGPGFSLRTKKGRLTGEWKLVDVNYSNGQSPNLFDYDIIWTFERDGDFEETYEYGSYSYSFEGEWEFEDDGEELKISRNIDNYTETFEINRLSSNELWIEVDSTEYELEKQ